jgi:hypothetical protein
MHNFVFIFRSSLMIDDKDSRTQGAIELKNREARKLLSITTLISSLPADKYTCVYPEKGGESTLNLSVSPCLSAAFIFIQILPWRIDNNTSHTDQD